MALSRIIFDNRFIQALPADTVTDNVPRQVYNAVYSWVAPTKVSNPQLVAVSEDLALTLGFTLSDCQSNDFAEVFTGNKRITGMQTYAICYGGHQFGHWAGQLGDGRAINLGEVVTASQGNQTLQLKGAGATPYSRTADGLAVLRSSIREFLCSEAMYHLGIATTRALSLCLTGEQVVRDMFYDGNAKAEPGAVVCRVSSSFLRFGSFQLPASRGDVELLTQLVNYCIKNDFPSLITGDSKDIGPEIYLRWFEQVAVNTCNMIVDWMRVGFVHGVMNTDNMSIIGETIDYGPYGWIDNFDLQWTPNTTDANGRRYRFGAQAEIGQWNLFQLANAIYPLVQEASALENILNDYAVQYQQKWHKMMANKLGLSKVLEQDSELFKELENILALVETDMTLFYRQLAQLPLIDDIKNITQTLSFFEHCYYNLEQIDSVYQQRFTSWLIRYTTRCQEDDFDNSQRQSLMNKTNPKYVLRNYLTQQAIEKAEQGDFSEIHRLQALLQHPYDEQEQYQHYAEKRPDWAINKAGCGMLSCSS